MKLKFRLIGLLLATVASSSAWADGRVASHNFFINLSRAKGTLPVNESTAVVTPTLIRGMYAISQKQGGAFVGFTNEAGTLFGDIRGFNVLSTTGAPIRPPTVDEVANLRSELIAAIDLDKLPKVMHGDGGGRSLVLFSAVDCPFCKGFEDSMRQLSGGLSSTMYIVPSSLQPIANGGLPKWQAVSNIWCAEKSGAAWLGFWANRSIPQPRQCEFSDPRVAELGSSQLKAILIAAGIKITGSPQILREDGSVIKNKPSMDAAYVKDTFGPTGMPPMTTKPAARWLIAGN